MLTSGFKESDQKEISLPEEDPDVVLDFFNVIHGKEQKGKQSGGKHLVRVAVMADMWMCTDALKDWVAKQLKEVAQNLSRNMDFGIFPPTAASSMFLNEQLSCEVDKNKEETYVYTIRSGDLKLVFDVKDIIEVAFVFELEDLLWCASRFTLVYSSGPGQGEIASRVPFPPIGTSGDTSIHGWFSPRQPALFLAS